METILRMQDVRLGAFPCFEIGNVVSQVLGNGELGRMRESLWNTKAEQLHFFFPHELGCFDISYLLEVGAQWFVVNLRSVAETIAHAIDTTVLGFKYAKIHGAFRWFL